MAIEQTQGYTDSNGNRAIRYVHDTPKNYAAKIMRTIVDAAYYWDGSDDEALTPREVQLIQAQLCKFANRMMRHVNIKEPEAK